MYKLFLLLFLFITFQTSSQTYSQLDSPTDSPYELNWAVDGPYLGVSIGLNALGFKMIRDKPYLTEEEVNLLSKDDVFILDRWAAGNYSSEADGISYIPFFSSFAMPLLFLINENERNHAGQISVLFVESMATAGALFTLTAGAIERSRPLVYNTNLPLDERRDNDAQRSFFAGHVAATGAATFFFAKVFSDFNPDSWAKPYIWTLGAAIPAYVGYLRIQSGKHFLTDSLLGYAVGALSGILIPELHKVKSENLDLSPSLGRYHKGVSLRYSF